MNPVDISFIVGLVLGLFIATVIGAIVGAMICAKAAERVEQLAGARGYKAGYDAASRCPVPEVSLPPGMCAHGVPMGDFCDKCWEAEVEEDGK